VEEGAITTKPLTRNLHWNASVHYCRYSPLRNSVAFVVMLGSIFIGGCASGSCRFQVVGSIVGATATQLATSPPLRTVVADALSPFGFTGGNRKHDGPYFYSLGGHGFVSRERIDVRLDDNTGQIGLLDYNHSTESDLVKRVIKSIQETASGYGVKVDFIPRKTRWTDCLGP
jgi:hypothetical protein